MIVKNKIILIFITFLSFVLKGQNIYTLAGSGLVGNGGDGGPATSAALDMPVGIALDALGNIYVSDEQCSCVRKINTSGIINTIAGTPGFAGYSGDGGPATSAKLGGPISVVIDASGNIYIGDNGIIRKVDNAGIITTFAGAGTSTVDGVLASSAQLNSVYSLAMDASGNIYLTDATRIRKINTSGIINTVAGNGTPGYSGDGGPATSAQLAAPVGVTLDGSGNLYIADASKCCIRKVNSSGIISTIAGTGIGGYSGDGGPAILAQIDPKGIAADNFGNVYVSDNDRLIRKINSSGIISTFSGTIVAAGYSGSGIPAYGAGLNWPMQMTTDALGNLYFCDRDNNRVREICVASCLAGINEIANNKELKLFPNPVSGVLHIESEQYIESATEIEIINCLGQVVFKTVFIKDVDVSNLVSGCYILKIQNNSLFYRSNFIKE
jgi:hypothetical protein